MWDYIFKKLNSDDDRIIVLQVKHLITDVIYYSSMESYSSELEAKEASLNKKKFVQLASVFSGEAGNTE